MKRLSILLLLLFSFSYSFTQTTLQNKVYFDSDKYILDDTDKEILSKLVSETAPFNEISLKIVGHTDQDGNEAYNMDLSRKRAQAVKKFLQQKGLSESDIEISYLGESALVHHSTDDNSKMLNRRVSIEMTGYSYNNMKELVSNLETSKDDEFAIDPDIESNLKLTKGTEVKIPQNAFCNMNGTPIEGGKVDMVFKEAFEYMDMVGMGLSTRTEDRLLETGGMIYIEASQNGQPLRLRDGKKIEMMFPEQEEKDGMELFTGLENGDGVIWEETGEEITSVKDNSDAPFIQVDLSPLLDLHLEAKDLPSLDMASMPAYPRAARIAYPPFKGNYTDEEFAEAVKKYEAVMAAREQDDIDRPAKLEEWTKEAKRRKKLLFDHKKYFVLTKVRKKINDNLRLLEKDKDRISHERLVNVLFAFIGNELGKIKGYDEWHYTKQTFGGTVVDVRKEIGLDFPMFDKMRAVRFFPELSGAIKQVQRSITEKKYELGYIDESVMSRYVLATSDLGWINCDRFYEWTEDQKMDLQFASSAKNDQFYLIFKNMNSLITPSRLDGQITFRGVPIGEDVRLVSVRFDEGNVLLAKHDFAIGSQEGMKLTYASANIKELKKVISEI